MFACIHSGDKRETASLIVAQLEPRLREIANAREGSPQRVVLDELSSEAITPIVSQLEASLGSMVKNVLHRTMDQHPTGMNSRPESSDGLTLEEIAKQFEEGKEQLEVKLEEIAADRDTFIQMVEQKHSLELELARARADHGKARSEKAAAEENFQKEGERMQEEVVQSKKAALEKEQLADELRNELQASTLISVNQQRASEKAHDAQLMEVRTLCGGMEAELAILRAQSVSSHEQYDRTYTELEKARDELASINSEHKRELLAAKEAELGAKAKVEALKERLTQQVREA